MKDTKKEGGKGGNGYLLREGIISPEGLKKEKKEAQKAGTSNLQDSIFIWESEDTFSIIHLGVGALKMYF